MVDINIHTGENARQNDSGSMHSTSGLSFLAYVDDKIGKLLLLYSCGGCNRQPPMVLASLLFHFGNNHCKAAGSVSGGFLLLTKKHTRSKTNAGIRQAVKPQGAICGEGKVKQYVFKCCGNQKIHF